MLRRLRYVWAVPAGTRGRRHRAPGFTLVELLVVVVIISVIIGMAVLSVSATGKDRELEQERDRLAALIGYVRERAELQTREYGLLANERGYEWLVYEPRTAAWAHDDLDSSLRTHSLPLGLRLSLVVDGHKVAFDEPKLGGPLGADSAASLMPQLLLYSSGDLPAFELQIERLDPARSVRIGTGDDGRITAGAVSDGST